MSEFAAFMKEYFPGIFKKRIERDIKENSPILIGIEEASFNSFLAHAAYLYSEKFCHGQYHVASEVVINRNKTDSKSAGRVDLIWLFNQVFHYIEIKGLAYGESSPRNDIELAAEWLIKAREQVMRIDINSCMPYYMVRRLDPILKSNYSNYRRIALSGLLCTNAPDVKDIDRSMKNCLEKKEIKEPLNIVEIPFPSDCMAVDFHKREDSMNVKWISVSKAFIFWFELQNQ